MKSKLILALEYAILILIVAVFATFMKSRFDSLEQRILESDTRIRHIQGILEGSEIQFKD